MAQFQQHRATNASEKVIYTGKTHTTGGRGNGASRSSDGRLDLKLSTPGSPGTGTNPEQLFAAGWSACFESAIAEAARRKKIKLAEEVEIDAEVDLHLDNGEYFLGARLNISVHGVDRSTAQSLVDDAAKICPYSKATLGNITVHYNVI